MDIEINNRFESLRGFYHDGKHYILHVWHSDKDSYMYDVYENKDGGVFGEGQELSMQEAIEDIIEFVCH